MADPLPRVVLRVEALERYLAVAGIETNRELARRMGTISESLAWKLRNDNYHPNAAVIFGLHRVFPTLKLEDLFELTFDPDTANQGKAA